MTDFLTVKGKIAMSNQNIQEYNPYKRISDRIRSIQNQTTKMSGSYDKLNKNYTEVKKCNVDEELLIIEQSALEAIILSAELLTATIAAREAVQ